MIAAAAQILVVVSGLWLMVVAGIMVAKPDTALAALGAMGSTALIQFGEHGLRLLAGLAFVGAAPVSKFPLAFQVFGGFLAVSSVLIMIAPRRWHQRYARYWAARIPIWSVRALAPVSAAAGAAVIWAAL